MRRIIVLIVSLMSFTIVFAAADDDYGYVEYDYEKWTLSAGATTVLPQGGGKMRGRSGATFRVGYYVGDFLSVEASASWMEHDAGLGLIGLWHWWGYEKFDPFFTFGARGWIEGEVGPTVGIGTFWHLNDNWSLRVDADATLGLDGDVEMVYSITASVQFFF